MDKKSEVGIICEWSKREEFRMEGRRGRVRPCLETKQQERG